MCMSCPARFETSVPSTGCRCRISTLTSRVLRGGPPQDRKLDQRRLRELANIFQPYEAAEARARSATARASHRGGTRITIRVPSHGATSAASAAAVPQGPGVDGRAGNPAPSHLLSSQTLFVGSSACHELEGSFAPRWQHSRRHRASLGPAHARGMRSPPPVYAMRSPRAPLQAAWMRTPSRRVPRAPAWQRSRSGSWPTWAWYCGTPLPSTWWCTTWVAPASAARPAGPALRGPPARQKGGDLSSSPRRGLPPSAERVHPSVCCLAAISAAAVGLHGDGSGLAASGPAPSG